MPHFTGTEPAHCGAVPRTETIIFHLLGKYGLFMRSVNNQTRIDMNTPLGHYPAMGRPSKSKHPVAVLRKETGLSQREFAERLGIAPDHLAQIECGRSVSRWLAGQIAQRFGALVPQGEHKKSGGPKPRAVVPGKPLEYNSDLPEYKAAHFRAWGRRVETVKLAVPRWPLGVRWMEVAKGLQAIERALGDDLAGEPIIEIPVRAADLADLRTRLTAALARTSGLDVRSLPKDESHAPDLIVHAVGKEGSPLLHVELKHMAARESVPPDIKYLWQTLAHWVKRPGRPPKPLAATDARASKT